MIEKLKEELQNLKKEEYTSKKAGNLRETYISDVDRLIQEYEKDSFDMRTLSKMLSALMSVFYKRAECMNSENEIAFNSSAAEPVITKEQLSGEVGMIKERAELISFMNNITTYRSALYAEKMGSLSKHLNELEDAAKKEGKSLEEIWEDKFDSLSDEKIEKEMQELDAFEDEILFKYGCTKKDALRLQEIVGDIPEFEGLL